MSANIIHLNRAFLCIDCQSISDHSRNCAYCGSSSILCLSRALNPPQGPTVTPERVQRTLDALEDSLK
jgi:hypothetical protein